MKEVTTITITLALVWLYIFVSYVLTVGELPDPLNRLITGDDYRFHPVWENDPNIESVVLNRHVSPTTAALNNLSPCLAVYAWKRTM